MTRKPAIALVFLVANSPPARLAPLFRIAPAETWITAKAIVFLIGLLVLLRPVWQDLYHYVRKNKREVVNSLWCAAVVFGILCILIFPISRDAQGNFEIERGLAESYAAMSSHPFAENSEYFYRRILMPSVAYYLHLRGTPLYEIFALACAGVMIFALVHFLRARTAFALMPAGGLHRGFLTVLAVATCGFAMVGVQWPGYPEQLGFVFMLLPAVVPLRTEARLGCIALALLAHDGAVFPLVPIVLVCFPKGERRLGLGLIAIYLVIFALSYGFRFSSALELHDTMGAQSYFRDLTDYPLTVLFGIFSSFKLFWVVFIIALVMTLKKRRYGLAAGFGALMFSFVPMLFLAWDVTRLANFAFVGLLLSLVFVYNETSSTSVLRHYVLPLLAVVSLAMPSYNVALWWVHHGETDNNGRHEAFREPGLYRLLSNHLPFTLPAGRPSP